MSPSHTVNAALNRCNTLLFGWIPDLSSTPVRRQAAIAGGVSILLHLLILLGLIIGAWVMPASRDRPATRAQSNLEVVVQPPTPAEPLVPAPLVEDRRPMIDPRGMQASEEAPKDAKFESDQNMQAGSEGQAKGILDLPSQDGRTDVPSFDFATQQVQLGLNEPAAPPSIFSEDARVSLRPDAAPAPSGVTPLYKPQPVVKPELEKATTAKPTETIAQPARQAIATPVPRPQVEQPTPEQLAFLTPSQEVSKATPIATPAPAAQANPGGAPAQPQKKVFQQQLQKSLVEGQISNRKKAGVDAIATPAAHWWRVTQNAIGSNWYLFTNQLGDMVTTGRVQVSFRINAKGQVRNIRLDSTSGNHALENACIRAIKETRIPLPPTDLMQELQNNELERVITFTYY